jgi:ribonuclease HI
LSRLDLYRIIKYMESFRNITIWTDGGSRGNPGPAGIGVHITENDATLAELAEAIGVTTNNQAEYGALVKGIDWVTQYCADQSINPSTVKLSIYTDSELMAYQVQGRYRVKNAELKPVYDRVMAGLQAFATHTITPVRREKNQIADGLVNKALDALAYTK